MTGTVSNGGQKMVTGIFSDGASVKRAYEAATGLGYGKGDINVVMSGGSTTTAFSFSWVSRRFLLGTRGASPSSGLPSAGNTSMPERRPIAWRCRGAPLSASAGPDPARAPRCRRTCREW
jgi:hypothetical protein